MHPEADIAALESWFERAAATPPAQRADVVRTAPPALQDPLERLLASMDDAEAALESPRWAVAGPSEAPHHPTPDALAPGTRAGSFTIREIIGRGGMGVVYRAEQDRPRREVALKVLAAPLATDLARRRFDREAQTLARLDHPGVVPIYEAGVLDETGAGTPYFAMPLVEGVSLASWAQPPSESGPPSRAKRLDLLARVCDAVEHAHQRGVLHRDLKPANILVDRQAHPHVLDFGVARLLGAEAEPTDATLWSDLAGTPAYMSPEQLLEGVAHTRGDIFALGIIAWEVLAGAYPFGAPPRTFERAVARARETSRPPAGASGLDADTQAVLLKAIAHDPDLRYRSAGELGDDLRRLAQGRPVLARPPTPAYLASRWVRRRPWQAALAGGSTAAILALGAWAIASSVEASRESRRRLQAAELAERRLDAQREFVMQSLVRTSHYLTALPGGHHLHFELLRDALPRLEALAAEAGDDLDLMCDLSDALTALSLSAGGLGTPNTGEPALADQLSARAMELSARALARAPDSPRALASRERAVSCAASLPSRQADRPELLAQGVALLTRIYELNGRRPADESRLAYRLLVYGSAVGDLDALTQSVRRYEHVLSVTPEDWESGVALGTALSPLARQLMEPDPVSAAAHAARAESLLSAAHLERPDNYSCARHLAVARHVRGNALARLGRVPECVRHLTASLETILANATDPTNTMHVADRATTSTNVMIAAELGLRSPNVTDADRAALREVGLRAHRAARLLPGGDDAFPEHLRPILQHADALAAQFGTADTADDRTPPGG